MSCMVLPSLKVEVFVASVARLFEEVICSLSLRSGCLVLPQVLALCLCFRLNTQRVWRVVVEWLLRLIGFPPSVGLVPTERVDGAGDLVAVHCASSSGVPVKVVFLPVSRREFSFDFFLSR